GPGVDLPLGERHRGRVALRDRRVDVVDVAGAELDLAVVDDRPVVSRFGALARDRLLYARGLGAGRLGEVLAGVDGLHDRGRPLVGQERDAHEFARPRWNLHSTT